MEITELMKEAYETAKKRGQTQGKTIKDGIASIKEEYNEFIDTLKGDDREHTLEEIADVIICSWSVKYQFDLKDCFEIDQIVGLTYGLADYLNFTSNEISDAIYKKMAYNKTRED